VGRYRPGSRVIPVIAILSILFALSPMGLWAAEGDMKWVFPADGSVGSITSSPAIGSDGTIYVGSADGKVYAVQPDGTKKWEFDTRSTVTSSPTVDYYSAEIVIYVGAGDGTVYAIDADGNQKWAFTAGGAVSSSPAISYLGVIYVGSEDNKVYAIRSSDGTAAEGEWPFVTQEKVTSSPAIDSEGTIYVGSEDQNLYAIRTTGREKWRKVTEGVISGSPAIREIGDTRVVYIGSQDGKVYALEAEDGSEIWTPFDTTSPALSSPAVDGVSELALYVGVEAARLYAVNLTDGSQAWVFTDAAEPVRSTPAIGSDGTLYVGADDKRLWAINQSNGRAKWWFETGGKVSSSPTIGFGGDVYVGSEDGRLYAFESSSPQLANVAWPKFRHDVRNVARTNQNIGPTADPGPDQTVSSGNTVTLDGSGSYDPDYGIPFYSWTQTEGTAVTLSDATAVKPSFTAPGVDSAETLTFELKVTDNGAKTSTDTCKITVNKSDSGKGCFISTARGGGGY